MELLLGDCLEVMRKFPADSVDAVVTDPPYGLAFMNKHWDYDVPTTELWKEVLRVLKPGGHLLAFFGTRTYHRGVVRIEDAGFEIRDQVQWIYGSGFPKSLDVSKAIDKAHGAERDIVFTKKKTQSYGLETNNCFGNDIDRGGIQNITAPATDDAKRWQGWGTALKPANEPIVLARKPLEKGLTVAENVVKWGTGAINVDGCRIAGSIPVVPQPKFNSTGKIYNMKTGTGRNGEMSRAEGRWPANVIFDEVAAESLGEPSRFFYVAKASKRERNAGLEGMPLKSQGAYGEFAGDGRGRQTEHQPTANYHPTVKPIKLMEYLIKLVTPPNGVVLDPFMGSGSTGVAAKNLGFSFRGIEKDPEYFEIAQKRNQPGHKAP